MKISRLLFMALLGMIISVIAVGCDSSSSSKDDRPSFTVTYYDGENELPDLQQVVVEGSEIILPTHYKEGFFFEGWRLNNAGSVITGKQTVDSDLNFYGTWTAIGSTDDEYPVEYFDGATRISGTVVASGTQITVAAAPTKAGSVFDTWMVNGQTAAAPGSSYTVTGPTAFLADWNPAQYEVTFDTDASLTKTDVGHGAQIVLPTLPVRPMELQLGWLADGSTGAPVMEATITANTHFTSQWEPTEGLAVQYYSDGALIAELTQNGLTEGQDINLADTRVKTGYTFTGWLENGAGDLKAAGSAYTVGGSVVFHAGWTANQYNVVFMDGASTVSSMAKEYNSTIAIPKAPAAKENFIFGGWINDGKGYVAGDSFVVTGDATFTARWTEQTAVMFYDENGKILADHTKKISVGEEIQLPDLHKPHYVFDGWLLENTGDPLKGNYLVSGTAKLYAKYTIKPTSPFNTADPEIAAYYGDETRSWLISPTELKAMLDNPAIAPNVIIWADVPRTAALVPAAGANGAKLIGIPGWNNSPGLDDGSITTNNRFLRDEGPIANEHQVMNGVNMDNRMQRLGVTKDSIVVLTSAWTTGGAGGNVIGWWWYMAYWGFSKDNLKILDGGNTGYRAEFGSAAMVMSDDPTNGITPYPATGSTTFSVKELPGDRFDSVRIGLGNNIKNIENGDYAAGRKVMFSSLTNAMGDWFEDEEGNKQTVNFYGFNYGGKMKGQKFLQTGDAPNNFVTVSSAEPDPDSGPDLTVYRYRTPEELKLVYRDREQLQSGNDVTLLPDDLGTSIGIWCGSGTTTQTWFMALQMAGYYNAANFGGNSNGWFTLAGHRLRLPNPNNDSTITTTVGMNLPQHANYKALDNSTHYSVMPTDPTDPTSGYQYSYRATLGVANVLCAPGLGGNNGIACDSANTVRPAAARQFLKWNDNGTFTVYDNKSRPTGQIIDPFTDTSFYKNELWPSVASTGAPIPDTAEDRRKDLNGNYKWDVAKWTDYITYNYNDAVHTHIYAIGNITMNPDYDGDANEISRADARYKYGAETPVAITFEDSEGVAYDHLATSAAPYTLVKLPEAPFKLYHDFDGWFVNDKEVEGFFEPQGATTVVAKFTMKTTSPYHADNAWYYDASGDGLIDNRSLIIEPTELKALLDGPNGDNVIIVNLGGTLANELAGVPNTDLAPTHKDGTPAFRISYSEWRDHFRMFTSDVGPTHVPNQTNPTTKAGPARMATVDKYLQSWGYDLDKIIVFTRNWSTATNNNVIGGMGGYTPTNPFTAATGFRDTGQSGMFNVMHLLYWGIAKDKIRVLNGGNQAYQAEVGSGSGKMSAEAKPVVTGNTFSVREFPGDRIGSQLAYTHMGDILSNVRRGDYAAGNAAFIGAGGTYIDTTHPFAFSFPTSANVAGFPKPLPKTYVEGDVVYRKYHTSGNYGMSGSWAGAVRGGDMFWLGNPATAIGGNTPGTAVTQLFDFQTGQTDLDTGAVIGTGNTAGIVVKVKPYEEFIANFKHGHTDIQILKDRFTRVAMHCGGSVSSMPVIVQFILHGFHVAAYSGAGEDWMYRGAFRAVNDLDITADTDNTTRVYNFWGPTPTQYLMYVDDATYAVYDNKSNFVANVSVDNRSLFIPINEKVLATEGRKWDPQAHTDFISFRLGGTAMDYRSYTGDGRGYIRQDLGDKYPEEHPFVADKEIPPIPGGETRYFGDYLSNWGLTH